MSNHNFKYDRCMRCNARWIKVGDIYCDDCFSMSHLEVCHADTMICNCHQFEPFPKRFTYPKRYKKYILQLRKELKDREERK